MRFLQDTSTAPVEPLRDALTAIVGYGNQGRVHAHNLRESGLRVVVGARSDSPSSRLARKDGFEVVTIPDAAARADLVILGVPDEAHGEVYAQHIAPHMRPGTTLGVMHGFSLRFGVLTPRKDVNVVMVAPKGPGTTLRERFLNGQGIPCLCAVHHDVAPPEAERIALAWAAGIGCLRAAAIFTTAGEEAETDLFGEQAVLCGGVTALIRTAFETLVEAGYAPELAYIECCHELKQVADLIYSMGLTGMHSAISSTAEFGSYVAQERLIDDTLRHRLRTMLDDIRSGAFARAMQDDRMSGSQHRTAHRDAARRHDIEAAGDIVRRLMPWLKAEGRERP